ncbi:MAG TPA: hypothetical protein DDW30_07240 [Clostridiales bacterium]|nr:hypothetical protein [Clostridiales bacterium]
MKRDDHLTLAAYLVGLCPERWRDKAMRTAFYAGAVLPDSNPATYLRGVTRAHKPAGHNTQWSYATVLRLLVGLRRDGVRGRRQAYRLGALTHYLADAFTYPHMPSFRGGISAHNRYERELHRVFGEAVGAADRNAPVPDDPFRFLCDELAESGVAVHTPRADSDRIVRVCTGIWRSVFQENSEKSPISNKKS